LGISLIAAGAAGLAAVAALNWNKIIEALRGPIGGIVAIASAALLALGIILVCSGVALPLGISLIAAGAAGLVAVTALNWNKIVEEIKGPVSKVITIASAALLMLGLILVCSGVALPLGIALIAAGAAGLATVTALNWNAILDWIKNVWNKIKSWWRTNVAPIFTLKYWTDLFKCIGEGLWNAIKAGINWVIDGINWLITQINKISFETPDWIPLIGGKRFGFNIPPIPRLASGAVIPPNSPRLAIVGDNRHEKELIAPESMFRQIVKEEIERIWGNGEITINLNNIMDGEVIAKKVIKVHNGIVRQTGASPLLI
jgi:hypothetical protein